MKLRPLESSLFEPLPQEVKTALLTNGVVPVADPILPLWNLSSGTNTIILIGGRGGMKTYGVSDFVAHQAAVNKKRCMVLRDEKSTIKESILNEILQRYDEIPFNTGCEKLSTGLKYKDQDIVFTKGFRASDNTKKANMKGVSNIDIAIIEEAEDLIDGDKFNTFVDSLRKEGCLIIILMNTPDIGHFLLKRYFDCTKPAQIPDNCPEVLRKEYDGYFEIEPKDIPGFTCIKTGFRENKWLPAHVVSNYLGYGDPSHHLYNPHYFLTAIEGYASTGRKGQVLRKVKPISFDEYMKLPFREFYGQDFGTAAPAGFVGVKFDGNNCYCRELNYLPMATLDIGKFYCSFGLGPQDRVVADNADKDACDKLESGWQAKELDREDVIKYPGLLKGFFIVKCIKGEGSIKAGIAIMEGLNLFAVKESVNLWNEIRMYVYAQDKNGEFINDPEKGFDHLIDPWRYVCMDQRGKKELFGI